MTKEETGVMGDTIHGENHASTRMLPVSRISITKLLAKINHENCNFLNVLGHNTELIIHWKILFIE